MAKKINCKHGLDKRQEIQARRLRVQIENNDTAIISKYNEWYNEWFTEIQMSFDDFLKSKDIVYYSALKRVVDAEGRRKAYKRFVY